MNALSTARWQRLIGGSLIRQWVLLGSGLMLLLGLAYIVHLRGLFIELEQGAEHAQRLQTERADKALQAQALVSREAQLAASYQQLEVSRWRLAAGGELAELLEGIAHQAQADGVLVEQLQLLPEIPHEQYIEMPMQLQLRGTYIALASFAQGLAQLPRLVTQENFSLSAVQLPGQAGLRLQLRASAYRSREPVAVSPGAEPQPSRTVPNFSRSPFAPSPRVQARQHLETLSLDQFEMVGSLTRHQLRFALLDAGGVVHRLQVGDRLGRDRGRIVRIEERQVHIAEEIFVVGQGWVERQRTLSMKVPASAG
ncbi:pilus assembly protein PilP [Pseudomonas sp. NUPR-001]|uniref:pilus assembly protein PilP n=1 Tax=Pseudomonas sp. NUPR-001 TaxID=3416058 RepID=UPI003F99EEFC